MSRSTSKAKTTAPADAPADSPTPAPAAPAEAVREVGPQTFEDHTSLSTDTADLSASRSVAPKPTNDTLPVGEVDGIDTASRSTDSSDLPASQSSTPAGVDGEDLAASRSVTSGPAADTQAAPSPADEDAAQAAQDLLQGPAAEPEAAAAPGGAGAAPLEAPKAAVAPLNPADEQAVVTASAGSAVSALALFAANGEQPPLLYDRLTGEPPAAEALFSIANRSKTLLRCNVRLMQRIYQPLAGGQIDKLLIAQGAEVPVERARQIVALLDEQTERLAAQTPAEPAE